MPLSRIVFCFFILCLSFVISPLKAGPLFAEPDSASVDMRLDSVVKSSMNYLGMRYCRGGVGNANCFDCSGFVSMIYSFYGIRLPHTSAGIALIGEPVKKRENLRPGDVVYFKGSNAKSSRVGHVGIVVQNDQYSVFFIHASVQKGVCLDEIDDGYYKKRYMGARRFIN